jgi:alkylation response protein AidB-like acyl-CoA dehydrogenase
MRNIGLRQQYWIDDDPMFNLHVASDMAIGLETARTVIWQAAWTLGHHEAYVDGSVPTLPLQTPAEIVISDTPQRVTLEAAQLFGGMGVMRELPMQKYVRDALLLLHSENTNDVARLRIAEDLAGYRRSGPMGSNIR